MHNHEKSQTIEQSIRTLRQQMSQAAWTAIEGVTNVFLDELVEKDAIWLRPKDMLTITSRLPLNERDGLFRGVLKYGRPLPTGGYHIEQVIARGPVLAIALTLFFHLGTTILVRPSIVEDA